MSKSEIAKRYILFIISLFFSALGVAFTKHGELGVSPISSVANVMSYKFPSLSLGTWLIIWNCSWADFHTSKKIPAHTAAADTTVFCIWLVH